MYIYFQILKTNWKFKTISIKIFNKIIILYIICFTDAFWSPKRRSWLGCVAHYLTNFLRNIKISLYSIGVRSRKKEPWKMSGTCKRHVSRLYPSELGEILTPLLRVTICSQVSACNLSGWKRLSYRWVSQCWCVSQK